MLLGTVAYHLIFLSSVGVRAFPKPSEVDPLKSLNISAPDGSARATFISFGATATNFWVKDKNGTFRDILLGFDNSSWYQTDEKGHPNFGPVVGRYANRIRNGTFTIPISKDASGPNKFHVPTNEHNGSNTLHGGLIGYDRRTWPVLKHSNDSIVFALYDPDGEQGFPGSVISTAVYTLKNNATWSISYYAVATEETPIMLSGHHYWNLEAYQETTDLLGHVAQFNASKVIATDGLLIPSGSYIDVAGTALDFREAKSIGGSINDTASAEYCGTDCVGFDNCWVYDNNDGNKTAFSMWSVNSGIRMDVVTNQPALQIYSCNGIFNATNPIPRKAAHGGPSEVYENHSCVVIEQESVIDAINNPEYGVDQIYGPGKLYDWQAEYTFSVLEE